MKIVLLDKIDLTEEAKQKIKDLPAEIHDDVPNKDEIIGRVESAEIITANYIDITSEIIDAAPKLRYIVVPAVGYEWVDYKHAAERGIKVINCPTHNSQAVAEHAMSLMFAVARRVVPAQASLRNGNWVKDEFSGIELAGKSLGLVGFGNIGTRVKVLAEGMGMKVSHVNSKSYSGELDEIMADSDVIIICAPLNGDTKGLIDARRIGLMKSSAILVNVARGAIVDQVALIQALEDKKIFGAGLDVFDGEPLVGEPSEAIVKLAQMNNVVATPHLAYSTKETAQRLGEELLANLSACLKGEPRNIVN